MPPRLPRSSSEIGSFAELRSHYDTAIAQLDDCRKMKGATNEALRYRTGEVRGAKEEATRAKRQVVTMTKSQHAKSKEKSSAAYASVAATTLIIFYQVVEVSGGWGKWESLFQHEAVIGVLQVAIGTVLAAAMRPLH
jgi:VIT1/CCC1 family predicted Fe2+/Mn2+ transporter